MNDSLTPIEAVPARAGRFPFFRPDRVSGIFGAALVAAVFVGPSLHGQERHRRDPPRSGSLTPSEARAINAAVPPAPGTGPVARPFFLLSGAVNIARARDCLAAAVFYEAGDRVEDEQAVAQVVLNRVHHPAFPKTVCGVVFQGAERHTGCQFTFACDGAMRRYTPPPAAWRRARMVAAAALAGAVYTPVGLATHYHADWVVPYWSATLDRIGRIGPHIFYRWTGPQGAPGAFSGQESGNEPAIGMLAGLSGAHGNGTEPVEADAGTGIGSAPPRTTIRPVLSTASDPGMFLIRLAGDSVGYLARARALCQDRDPCTVFGWTDPRLVARSLPLTPDQMGGLAFHYVRNHAGSVARWDCARTPRHDKAECMRSGLLLDAPPGSVG